MKKTKLHKVLGILAATVLASGLVMGCDMKLDDEDNRANVSSNNTTGNTETSTATQTSVDGTWTAAAGKVFEDGAAGTVDLTAFDTSKGLSLSFYIQNTTTDQTCVFQTSGNIQICAGYVWAVDEKGGGFVEGDNTITANTWEKACGTHYETIVFNTDGSVDWYLDGELTFNWTGKTTQITALFSEIKAAVLNILPQTNSTTDVTVSNVSYSSALTADGAAALYESFNPSTSSLSASEDENTDNTNTDNTDSENESTIPTETDYVVGTEDCTTSWSAGSTYTIASGETQTVYFKNYSSGAANWNNFLIELWNTDNESAVTLRADNYGWNYGSANTEFSYDSVSTDGSVLPADWAAWLTAINGATVKLVVTYEDGTITFTATSDDVADWAQVYSFSGCTSSELYWHFNVDGSYLVVLK